jgi:hypothetical protein
MIWSLQSWHRFALINGNCSRMLRRFVCRWHFVCQMCARPERPAREFCRAVADRATTLAFVSTLFAHLQTQDTAKLSIRRPGLADAGSVAATLARRRTPRAP